QERNVNSSEDAFGLRRVCDPRCLVGQGLLLVILDSNSLTTACQWLAEIQDSQLEAPVIAVTEKIEPDQIQTMLDCGVYDFMVAPLNPTDVIARVKRCLELACQRQSPVHTSKETLGLERLIGKSSVFRKEIEKIPRLARCDASVLIAGETGTG